MSRLFLLIFCLSVVNVGCGGADRPDLVEAEGSVTLDGQPLAGAQVSLQMIDPPPEFQRPTIITTDTQGKFRPQTYGDTPGLPVGKYNVAVRKRESTVPLDEGYDADSDTINGKPVQWKLIVPRKYEDIEKSGLTLEVTDSGLNPETLALTTDGAQPEIESSKIAPDPNAP